MASAGVARTLFTIFFALVSISGAHVFRKVTLNSVDVASEPLGPFSYTVVHSPPGKPAGSVIFLAPWGATTGWLTSWYGPVLPHFVANRWRLIEGIGKQTVGETSALVNSWYAYEHWQSETPVATDVDLAVAYIHALIQQEYSIVGNYQHITLAGHSQGAVLALEAGFRFPQTLGLVISQRGVVFKSRIDGNPLNTQKLTATPHILTAGVDDDVFTAAWVKQGYNFLHGKGVPSYFMEFTGLNHYRRCARENNLALGAVKQVMSLTPPKAMMFAKLFNWTAF